MSEAVYGSKLDSLERIAQDCHVDKAYLCHLFKRYSNETPLRMLTRLKMRRAADSMLADPSRAIKQVADEAGSGSLLFFPRLQARLRDFSGSLHRDLPAA